MKDKPNRFSDAFGAFCFGTASFGLISSWATGGHPFHLASGVFFSYVTWIFYKHGVLLSPQRI